MNNINRCILLIALVAGLVSFLVFMRTLSCGFVDWDDPGFVINNTAIRHLDRNLFMWVFSTWGKSFEPWILTYLSLAVDYHFWELNPLGYHLTNILLHAANTGMVVLIAHQLCRKWLAASEECPVMNYRYGAMLLLAGLLFGSHPLRVESVAWISERKDVLNGLLTFTSIFYYLRYTQHDAERGESGRRTRAYLVSLTLFLFSLLAKPISVTLPVVLLVLDWFPLERLRRQYILPVLAEKIPYLVLSTAVSIGTMAFAAKSEYLQLTGEYPFWSRLVLTGNAIFEYCRFLIYPVGTSPLNIIPEPFPVAFALKAGLVLVTTMAILLAGHKRRGLQAMWLCFIIPLLPVLPLVRVSGMAFEDHSTYIPSVAPCIALAMLGAKHAGQVALLDPRLRIGALVLVGSILVSYAIITVRLIPVWDNSGTFWSRVIEVQPLGRAYQERGIYNFHNKKYQGVVDDFSAAIDIGTEWGMPPNYNLFALRGVSLACLGRYDEAVKDLTRAIDLNPHPAYFRERGLSLKSLGRGREAEEDFTRAGPNSQPVDWFSGQ